MGPAVPFDLTIDPKGILASMSDDKHFHGIEYMVKYYTAHRRFNGRHDKVRTR